MGEDAEVESCYEAGRDGFWLHRFLEKKGVKNLVVDLASIEVSRRFRRVKTDRMDLGKLLGMLMSQKLSRELGEYSAPSPAARAVRQLEATGKEVRPGQRVRFLFTLGKPGVRAWDVPDQPDPRSVDVKRYQTLLKRAVDTVLDPIKQSVYGGKDEECLYLFPIKSAEPLGEGGTQRLGGDNLSSKHNSFKVIR